MEFSAYARTVGFTPASGLGEQPLFSGAWGELDINIPIGSNGEEWETRRTSGTQWRRREQVAH